MTPRRGWRLAMTRLARVGLICALSAATTGRTVGAQNVPEAAIPSVDAAVRTQLQQACAAVWLAWGRNDQAMLRQITPPNIVTVLTPGDVVWGDRAQFIAAAQAFAAHHGHIVLLEFTTADVQLIDDAAVLYSRYIFTFDYEGRRQTVVGRLSMVFIRRDGVWQGVSWHLDASK